MPAKSWSSAGATTPSSSERPAGPGGITAWHPPDLGGVSPSVVAATAASIADDEAHRLAWLEGHAAAMAERDNSLADAVAACAVARRALHDTAGQLRQQVGATVHALAVAIARHLIEHELAQDPLHIQKLVTRALALAPLSGPVTVRLNPADLAALHALGGITDLPMGGVELRWAPDETISRGGCVVDGPSAIIDGRIDRALLDIYERISHD